MWKWKEKNINKMNLKMIHLYNWSKETFWKLGQTEKWGMKKKWPKENFKNKEYIFLTIGEYSESLVSWTCRKYAWGFSRMPKFDKVEDPRSLLLPVTMQIIISVRNNLSQLYICIVTTSLEICMVMNMFSIKSHTWKNIGTQFYLKFQKFNILLVIAKTILPTMSIIHMIILIIIVYVINIFLTLLNIIKVMFLHRFKKKIVKSKALNFKTF